jgi:hypothetical protein
MNNKILFALFLLLLVVFGLTKLFSGKNDRTFDPEIIKVDSTQVTSVIIQSKADSLQQILLRKEGELWTVSKNNKTMPADREVVQQLLANLSLVKASHIAAKSKDKWASFEIEEGKASQLTVYSGNKKISDFCVGKYSFNQEAKQVITYFRLKNGEEVYAVDGMTGMLLGQGFNAYRDKQLLSLDISAVQQLTYEGDIPYKVEMKDGQWFLDRGSKLDSSIVKNFLLNLRNMAGEDFVDDFDPSQNIDKLLKKLTVSGSNMPQQVIVQCWRDTTREKPFVIQSSQFPLSFFASDSTRLFSRIFKPVREW